MRDQVLWRKEGRIVALLAERLDIDTERALDILYNSRTFALLANPDSGLQLQSDEYILNDLLQELDI
jgi:energy-converting hydrogenase A subunit M